VPAVDEAGGASVSRRTMPVHTTTFESIGEPRRSAPRVPTR
jgi:hypothetical protein